MPKASSEIVNWLRDFDPDMVIRWSVILNAWVLERKAVIDELVRVELHAAARISYDTNETNSAMSAALTLRRKVAIAELRAMEQGRRVHSWIPNSDNYVDAIKRDLSAEDPWRFGAPGDVGEEEAAKRLADHIQHQDILRDRRLKEAFKREIRARWTDVKRTAQRAQGSRISAPGLLN